MTPATLTVPSTRTQLSRRAVIRWGVAVPIGAVALGSLSSCAATAGATPFMTLLGEKLAEGFGLAAGAVLADEAAEALGKAVDNLVDALGDDPSDSLYGYADDFADGSAWSVLAAGVVGSGDDSYKSFASIESGDGLIVVPAVVALGAAYYAAFVTHERVVQTGARGKQVAAIYRQVRRDYAIQVWEAQEGDEDLGSKAVITAVVANGVNLEVTWDPSTERTEQSRLQVREGLMLKGAKDDWYQTQSWGIPSYQLWDLKD